MEGVVLWVWPENDGVDKRLPRRYNQVYGNALMATCGGPFTNGFIINRAVLTVGLRCCNMLKKAHYSTFASTPDDVYPVLRMVDMVRKSYIKTT